jgi:spermidine synthase
MPELSPNRRPVQEPAVSAWSRPREYAELFVISFVILFFELTCIRWFGSTVVFLTFFTNLVLMACFLGMTVGCLAASRRRDFINLVVPLTLVAAALAHGVLWGYNHYAQVTIDVGGQRSPQQVFFGTEVRPSDPSQFVIPIEAIAGLFYALIALIFVGLGQTMGRGFNAIPNRVLAYSTNVLGSLIGIVTFGVVSWYRLPPLVWFAVGLVPVLAFATWARWFQLACLSGLLVLMAALAVLDSGAKTETTWSPYYKVRYDKRTRYIYVNNIMHQGMLSVARSGSAYALPHLLNRDAGGGPFDDVLVIGAGSGNDVEAALAHGAKHVDAVEIDPRIYELGREYHPDHPYDDPRVTVHLDDGRSFVQKTERKYDLVVYALLDSLALHSGYSSLRLESFLFTEQAFRAIKAKLKPGGVFAMYNFFRQGWVVGRLETMVERVFGTAPIVISLPYLERITPGDPQGLHITFLLAGNTEATVVEAIREALRTNQFFWAHSAPMLNESINAYGPKPSANGGPPDAWQKIGVAAVETQGIRWTPTDDWPFLYLREPVIPALNLRGMAIVAAVSLAILFVFAPGRAARPSGRMFFLGAGFMLLETKGVVHMALLFGSTWVVNSIVFFAILVMVLLSNLYVMVVRPRRLIAVYTLLIAALLVNATVPMSVFLALPGSARVVVSCLVVFLPIFFAGTIFAVSFRDSPRPDVDFGSNIGGVILGGLSENVSLFVGFNHLLYLAIAYYLLSAVLKPRISVPAGAA